MGSKDWFQVNRKLLPFKLHFFFLFGGFAGVLPFMPIIAKQLGINATAVGIGYSMIPVFIFLANPVLGILVDYFQNIKAFLIILLVSCSIAYLPVLFLPEIEYETETKIYVQFEKLPAIKLPLIFEKTCFEELLNSTELNCKLMFTKNVTCDSKDISLTNSTNVIDLVYNTTFPKVGNKSSNTKYYATFYASENSIIDTDCIIDSLTSFHCMPSIHPCLFVEEYSSVFYTYQFWTFITLAILGGVTFISLMTLSSAATLEALGTQIEVYGRQRLFGTISWGIVCPLAGILNDLPKSGEQSFAPGFYLMATFFAVDIVILCLINIPKTHISGNVCSDLGKIFSSIDILTFSFGAILVGFLNALNVMYEFWFLQDMGASKTLLGLAIGMQCLVGEVPFLFFSGWFVNKLGHFLCLATALAGFAIRMLLYSVIADPWFALPIDILHGVTFGIYHGAMASISEVKAPKGMETTLLGLFGGLYDGLGMGLGSFLGGIGLDNLGPRRLFFSASMLSVAGFVTFLVAAYFLRSDRVVKKKVAPLSQEIEIGVK